MEPTQINILLDPEMPTNAVCAHVCGDTEEVSVAPHVQADALALLDKRISMEAAEAMDEEIS